MLTDCAVGSDESVLDAKPSQTPKDATPPSDASMSPSGVEDTEATPEITHYGLALAANWTIHDDGPEA